MVELSKGGFCWPPAHLVASNMERFEAGLLREHTPCRPAELLQVAQRMAEVHAELLLIHPFREGNGRLARWLADLMALQAGYVAPLYRFRGRGSKDNRARYLEAVKRGYLQEKCGFYALAMADRCLLYGTVVFNLQTWCGRGVSYEKDRDCFDRLLRGGESCRVCWQGQSANRQGQRQSPRGGCYQGLI